MKLRKHQARFLKQNPNKALLCWEMRTGKSLPAAMWGKLRDRNCIIVCPKQLKKGWQELAPYATVYSKEEFKKIYNSISMPAALIVDEAHVFASAVFTPKRSQLAVAMYNFIQSHPDMDVLLLTATPIRNDPASLHTLLCFIGVYIPWKAWRSEFYTLEGRPFLRFKAWFPKADWRIKIRAYLEKYADIVSLRDCVEYLPQTTIEIVDIKTPEYHPALGADDMHWTQEHMHEQVNKAAYIKTLGYRKILIACKYTDQIDALKKELSKEREVFVLDGRTKDSDAVKKAAQEADECYFIVQASMGFGFEGYMFGALVFASMSHTALDHTQMLGRMNSVDHHDPIFIYYLNGGRWDKRIYSAVIKNQDFNPHTYLHATPAT